MEKRKLMALASSAAMVMASMGIAPAVMEAEVEKPEKITVMFDGTCLLYTSWAVLVLWQPHAI